MVDDNGTERKLPRRLVDLDEETIRWLDRLTTEERTALIWAGHLPEEKRKRLDMFLSLEKDKFQAGFQVVELWTKVSWIARTSTKLLLFVAGTLVAINQVLAYFSSPVGKP
ncbi:MAG: hypothetical protein EOS73_25395 [Mesorhizobium sp.]|uniref:hypothetical protein n=1 Tax=Mesorhizobium sp. M7A.F.Ca.ET.027.02.1.1 TaxID=2496655 RepID=UPI000FD4683F|nr:hypothetical protein [Mesorhizobium sp. M7A.F.Ca.ET.027.02.1.1]RVD16851.1 hypothetical protein EN749_10885 [Mesorhizobium sp. M7A.F.Ca.ET.027.02.1.1]RWD00489.1 MAG: hypothetical protein EOS73_25395 [Mesorhizobium sp.]